MAVDIGIIKNYFGQYFVQVLYSREHNLNRPYRLLLVCQIKLKFLINTNALYKASL